MKEVSLCLCHRMDDNFNTEIEFGNLFHDYRERRQAWDRFRRIDAGVLKSLKIRA
jgi:hypothetical protein